MSCREAHRTWMKLSSAIDPNIALSFLFSIRVFSQKAKKTRIRIHAHRVYTANMIALSLIYRSYMYEGAIGKPK